jgi:CBS domain-containing protein
MMTVNELMTPDPACCTPNTSLRDVARLMIDCDCGEIPVIAAGEGNRLIGVITDRDIVCRTLALGKNPLELTARECMSSPVISVTPWTNLDECRRLMEKHQIRRMPVVDRSGVCCGIVAQADIAECALDWESAELLKEVSRHPNGSSHDGVRMDISER